MVTAGYTVDEIRGFVREYHLLPHGTKGAWLARQEFGETQLRRWRKAFLGGDLDRGIIPRDHSGMSHRQQLAAVEKDRGRQVAAHEAELARLHGRIRELEATNEALGKAIGLLHALSEQEPDGSKTNEPNSS